MFKHMKKILTVGTLAVSTAVLLAGCGGAPSAAGGSGAGTEIAGKISASGSTALLPLLKPAQEEFQNKNAKVTVNVAGGGSFTGMNQVAEGSVDIGDSDVNLPDEYKDKGLVDHKVVVEPFVFIVDKANKVDNLTKTAGHRHHDRQGHELESGRWCGSEDHTDSPG
ncbi:MAG: substrate-binding domain-containing protein [Selenomonas sp.]|nr:substrate-binding domain-containing protein [Selenomonas sp.]